MHSAWLTNFLSKPEFQDMGHGQSVADKNLGLGWVYYSLARALRPQHIVCIGSYRGFVPILFGRALMENDGAKGTVTFIDPSFVDDFWRDSLLVREHFNSYEVPNIQHHCLTTQQFAQSNYYEDLGAIDFLFIDGYHSAAQAKIDHETFLPKLAQDHIVFFHDSISRRVSKIYGEEKQYPYSVVDYIDELKATGTYQAFDINVENGLTIVKSAR